MLSVLGNETYENYATVCENLLSNYLGEKKNASDLAFDIDYYQILFRDFLKKVEDRKFRSLSEKEKEKIYETVIKYYRKALAESFQKGVNQLFAILWRTETDHSIENFKTAAYKEFILDLTGKQFSRSEMEEQLLTPDVLKLLRLTLKHFEATREYIMNDCIVFSRVGMTVGYDLICEHLKVKIESSETSPMLSVPINKPFRLTPAFNAMYALSTNGVERWDIIWNPYLYGWDYKSLVIGKIHIWKLRYIELTEQKGKDIPQINLLVQIVEELDRDDDSNLFSIYEDIYYCDFTLSSNTDGNGGPRQVSQLEFSLIQESIQREILKRLRIPQRNIIFMMS